MEPSKSNDSLTKIKRKKLVCMALRFQLCVFLCGAMVCMMFSNLSLTVTLLCMVDDGRTLQQHENASSNSSMATMAIKNSTEQWWVQSTPLIPTTTPRQQSVKWSPQIQGLLLSALSWGRLLTPVMGLLADRLDFSWLLTAALTLAGIATALIPISADAGFGLVMLWRVLIGLSDAVVSPGVNQLISAWYPMKVRNSALSWATGGRQLGVLLVYPIGGSFCTNGNRWGWPSVYYLGSALFCIWLMLWIPFVLFRLRKRKRKIGSSPSQDQAVHLQKDRLRLRDHWKQMLTCTALWANIIGVLCHEIPFTVLLLFIPEFIRDFLSCATDLAGILSPLPIICFLLIKVVASQADHLLRSRNLLKPTCAAKIFNAIGCAGLGGFLIALAFVTEDDRVLVIALLCSATGFAGFHTPGAIGTLISIAPSFSGVISGLTFLLISIGSMISPIVIESVVPERTCEQWRRVMIGAGIIALLPLVIFTLWGSADVQPWAQIKPSTAPAAISNDISTTKDQKK